LTFFWSNLIVHQLDKKKDLMVSRCTAQLWKSSHMCYIFNYL